MTSLVLHAGVEDKLRDIQSITDVTLSRLDEQDLLAELLERTREILHADTATVQLLDSSSGQLVAAEAAGLATQAAALATEAAGPAKGIRALMGVPLIASGNVVGVLRVGSRTDRKFTADDLELLRLAADRAAATVQSLIAHGERIAAAALQRSLLPAALPASGGMAMAARYVPGDGAVGGDWYDVFSLPSGQLGVVIGDVTGSGLAAAVIMGRIRSALRAYAMETADPAEVLARLDADTQHFEPGALATVLYAVFEPGLGQVHVCSAGHYPPVVACPGQPAGLADVASGLLIGATPGAQRPVTTLEITPGTLVCFFTGGLIERRDQPIDRGLARLCDAVTAESPDAACAAVMAALVTREPARDDIALLMVQRSALGGASS